MRHSNLVFHMHVVKELIYTILIIHIPKNLLLLMFTIWDNFRITKMLHKK